MTVTPGIASSFRTVETLICAFGKEAAVSDHGTEQHRNHGIGTPARQPSDRNVLRRGCRNPVGRPNLWTSGTNKLPGDPSKTRDEILQLVMLQIVMAPLIEVGKTRLWQRLQGFQLGRVVNLAGLDQA